ncbi:hypothetical protein AsGV053 [Agrotis segetum granulovirus]|uniref:Uncharacterized protein n=1 Tax=Agrotis segetum granulosis virus TaxID=10464 RepID=A0A023MIC2_GVAS|nr:hypothetical protein AsGV053 [Agrotis segetum granulovirus]AHN92092.1 hypothetical protein AsGV053 [Agrotis segetum granulovirus]AKN63327.1 hypothetical protein AsGV053 [Agrotis segetum granulovirus]
MNRAVVNWVRERNICTDKEKRIRNLLIVNGGLENTPNVNSLDTEELLIRVLKKLTEERIVHQAGGKKTTSINVDYITLFPNERESLFNARRGGRGRGGLGRGGGNGNDGDDASQIKPELRKLLSTKPNYSQPESVREYILQMARALVECDRRADPATVEASIISTNYHRRTDLENADLLNELKRCKKKLNDCMIRNYTLLSGGQESQSSPPRPPPSPPPPDDDRFRAQGEPYESTQLLIDENKELKRNYSRLQRELRDMQTRLSEADYSLEQCRDALEKCEANNIYLQNELQAQSDLVITLRDRLEEYEVKNRYKDELLADCTNQLDQEQIRRNELEGRLRNTALDESNSYDEQRDVPNNADRFVLERRCRETEELRQQELEKHERAINQAKERIDELQKSLQDYIQQLNDCREELRFSSRKMEDTARLYKQHDNEIEALTTEKEQLIQDKAELEEKHEKCLTLITQARKAISQLQTENEQLKQRQKINDEEEVATTEGGGGSGNDDQSNKVRQLLRDSQINADIITSLNTQIAALKEANKQLERQVDDVVAETRNTMEANSKKRLEEVRKDFQESIDEYENRLNALKATYDLNHTELGEDSSLFLPVKRLMVSCVEALSIQPELVENVSLQRKIYPQFVDSITDNLNTNATNLLLFTQQINNAYAKLVSDRLNVPNPDIFKDISERTKLLRAINNTTINRQEDSVVVTPGPSTVPSVSSRPLQKPDIAPNITKAFNRVMIPQNVSENPFDVPEQNKVPSLQEEIEAYDYQENIMRAKSPVTKTSSTKQKIEDYFATGKRKRKSASKPAPVPKPKKTKKKSKVSEEGEEEGLGSIIKTAK